MPERDRDRRAEPERRGRFRGCAEDGVGIGHQPVGFRTASLSQPMSSKRRARAPACEDGTGRRAHPPELGSWRKRLDAGYEHSERGSRGRIDAASLGAKAASLTTERVDAAAWRRPSLRALLTHIKLYMKTSSSR